MVQRAVHTLGSMNETDPSGGRLRREMLSKVPDVTIWFWIIKILCLTSLLASVS